MFRKMSYIFPSKITDVLNHLQVHKILKSSGVPTDFGSITQSLNDVLKQFINLCKSGGSLLTLNKTLEDILKIQKCSSLIHPQTKYASLLVNILIKLFKLKNIERKRLNNGNHRVLSKINDLINDVCLFQCCFQGSPEIMLVGKLVKLYMIQFLYEHISFSNVTEKDMDKYRDHVISFANSHSLELPLQISEERHFNLLHYFLHTPRLIVSSDITHSTATILSPVTNTDRINEFPSHLSFSVAVEAETQHVAPQDLAVRVRYPGSVDVVCQPVVESQLQDYYQNTVFMGASAWSHPGLIELSVVCCYEFQEHESCLSEIYGCEHVWLGLSEAVQLKIHPRLPK